MRTKCQLKRFSLNVLKNLVRYAGSMLNLVCSIRASCINI